jgi:OOP family OmpA-OmpF porin
MELSKIENINLTGSDFRARLYQAYRDLARTEYQEGDYGNSDRFALRARAAAAGENVQPEEVRAERIPADKMGELITARQRLVALLANPASRNEATDTARAQAMFDCWVEEQEENIQPDDIAACRRAFQDAIGRVEAALAPPRPVAQPALPPPAPPTPVAAPAAQPAPAAAPVPRTFVVYFDFNKAALDDAAKATLAEAMVEAQKLGDVRLTVGGHTDLVGPDKYNQKLSELRAAAAAKFFQAAGLKPAAIAAKGFGKSSPVKATGDREAANRRVEIRLEKR